MLFLKEEDVSQLLDMETALRVVEGAFRELAEGTASLLPRSRLRFPQGLLHFMAAALPSQGVVGYKSYTSLREGTRSWCFLYSMENGEPLAMIEAGRLGQMRTGAASGVAAKYLARPEASRVGIIGSGWQARSQLMALCAVRPIQQVKVYSPNPDHRQAFATEMTELLRVPVEPVASPAQAVQGVHILTTITTSREPVFDGALLEPGTHLNAVGSNANIRQEIALEAVRRSDLIVVDHREQARLECGDLLPAIEQGLVAWDQVQELADIVAGKAPGRRDDHSITLFESLGLALEDVAAAAVVYQRARERGLGREIAL